MNLLERRRAMMSRKAEPEQWDLVLKAGSDGVISPVNATNTYGLSWKRGETLTLAWDATGFDGNTTRVCLWTNNGGPIFYEYQLEDVKGEMSFAFEDYSTTARSRTILLSRSWDNRNGPRFMGKYIKLRITPTA